MVITLLFAIKLKDTTNGNPLMISLVDIIFFFWVKWLHLAQFAYGDYKS